MIKPQNQTKKPIYKPTQPILGKAGKQNKQAKSIAAGRELHRPTAGETKPYQEFLQTAIETQTEEHRETHLALNSGLWIKHSTHQGRLR